MSTSVDERVTDEVEALEAILLDDVVITREDGVPKVIETVVHPSTADDVDLQFVCVTLEVKITPNYPDESPDVALRNPRGLDDQTLATINSQITKKLTDCKGQSLVFELIELVRENLTESNLPSGQCVICLYGFAEGDVFIKTQCYHHFHSHCLASHLIAGEKYYQEEYDKLPSWQQMQAAPYQQTCPVCRCPVSCDVEALKASPLPIESVTAPPFCLTAELRALQRKMATLLARQIARGGVVGMGDTGPPPLTITTASDNEEEESKPNKGRDPPKAEAAHGRPTTSAQPAPRPAQPGAPDETKPAYRGPYRGFNRRGKPGRRPRGAPR